MNNLRIIGIIVFTILVIIYGCESTRNAYLQDYKNEIVLSEAQQREYNYALTEATKQKVFGNIQQAAALYNKCIEVNPQSDVAYYQLAVLYMRSGNNREAIDKTVKAIELNDKNFWYYIQLATLYQIVEKKDSAIIVLERISDLWPENNTIKFDLAFNYAARGNNEKAIRILDEIEIENGISEKVCLLKKQIYVNNGEIIKAIDEISKLIKLAPDEIKYLGILAELYGANNQDAEAMRCYNKIFELEPENGLAQLSISGYYRAKGEFENYFIIQEKIINNEKIVLEKKLEVLVMMVSDRELIINYKNDLEKLFKEVIIRYSEDTRVMTIYGDYLVKAGRYEEAKIQFEKVLEKNISNYFVWEQLIFLYSNINDSEEIYEKCNEALKLFPDRPVLYLFKGNIELIKHDFINSIKTLEKGLNYSGNNNDLKLQFYSFLAEAYRNIEDDKKSDDCFEKALEIDPENIILLNNYSYYLSIRSERLNEAEKMSKIAITKEPNNQTYLDTYAWILYKMGKYKKALEYIERTIQNGGTEDPDILEHYGDILVELKEKTEAVKYWKLAIKFGGNEVNLNKKIEENKF